MRSAASPFGAGWTLDGLERLYEQLDGDVVLTRGDGTITGFGHDGAGRLTQPSTPAGQPIDLDYDRARPPLSRYRRP